MDRPYLILIVLVSLIAAALATVWLARRWQRRRAARAAAPAALLVRHPVVLAHGICGFDHIGLLGWRHDYFRGIVAHLRAAGVPVYAPRVAPLGSVPERARQLADFIRALPHPTVTVIAHSMGGLDARFAISRLGMHERVGELITIGTPHHGTPLADLAGLRPARWARAVAARAGLRTDALDWLTPTSLARFNAEVPDAPGVRYWSVIGTSRLRQLNPLLLPSHLFIRRRAGANDGMVPVSSQRWGTPIDEIEAHHLAQIGWTLRHRTIAFYERLFLRLEDGRRSAAEILDDGDGRAVDVDTAA